MIAYSIEKAKLDDMNKYFIFLFGLLFLISCSSTEEKKISSPLVEDKYRLKEDREEISKLRSEIPEDKRQENDEIALNLKWMNEKRLTPSEVRSRFSQLASRKRRVFNQDLNKGRQEFSNQERKTRKEFDLKMKDERDTIRGYTKRTSKEKKELIDELEIKRKEFNLSQKSQRDAFEEEVKDKKKSFDDYMKQKQDEFNADLKTYTGEFNDKKKEEKEKQNNKGGGKM